MAMDLQKLLVFLAVSSFSTTSSTCPSPEELMDVVANSSYYAQAHPGLVTKESVSGFSSDFGTPGWWLKIPFFSSFLPEKNLGT